MNPLIQFKTTSLLVLIVSVFLTAGAYAAASGNVVKVPSTRYPTIQSGIDAVPNGGTVLIAPGIYSESLQIAGKSVTLLGSGTNATKIRPPNVDLPGVAFASDGGGLVQALAIAGGSYGIEGLGSGNPIAGGFGPTVALQDVLLVHSSRGVFGSFSQISLSRVTIENTGWNGASILAAICQASNVVVRNAFGVGILVQAPAPQATPFTFDNVVADGNSRGGLEVHGNGTGVTITNSFFLSNGRAGIFLNGAGTVSISNTSASFTQQLNDGSFGDGIDAFNSSPVSTDSVNTSFNKRAGMGAFSTQITVDSGTLYYNPISFDAEGTGGFSIDAATVCLTTDLTDFCQVLSSSIQPPQPVGP